MIREPHSASSNRATPDRPATHNGVPEVGAGLLTRAGCTVPQVRLASITILSSGLPCVSTAFPRPRLRTRSPRRDWRIRTMSVAALPATDRFQRRQPDADRRADSPGPTRPALPGDILSTIRRSVPHRRVRSHRPCLIGRALSTSAPALPSRSPARSPEPGADGSDAAPSPDGLRLRRPTRPESSI